MEYKRSLYKKIKLNKFAIILGVAIAILAICRIPFQLINGISIEPFDWIITFSYLFFGYYWILLGTNFYFGKSYLIINDEHLLLRPDFSKTLKQYNKS